MIGGLGWLAFGSGAPMVGASGAIMGIIGIFLVLFPRNDVTVLVLLRGGGTFEIAAGWLIAFYMLADLVGTLSADQGVAYIAHLSGELTGAGLACAMVLTRWVKPTKYEENLLQALGWAKKAKRRSLREI